MQFTKGTPIGASLSEFYPVKNNNDFGYEYLLKKGIESGTSILSLVTESEPIRKFVKDDAPLTTTTTAAFNPVYGRDVFVWQNMKYSLMGALYKQPWTRSGIRVKVANSTSLVSGLDETGALPESDKPTYALLKYPLKQMVTRLDYTAKMARLSNSGDDAIPTPDQLVMDRTEEHMLGLNKALLANAETQAAAATGNYTGVSVFESLDRLISCKNEEADLGGTYNNWYNPYFGGTVYDREGSNIYDAVVVHGDGTVCYQNSANPNFAVDATLTLEAKDALLEQCLTNGLKRENAMWVTGYDTYFRLKQLYETKQRYLGKSRFTFNVNGINTPTGEEVGFELATMDDIPVIIDENCPKDTISKLFLIDRSAIGLHIATPTVMIDLGFPAFSTIGGILKQRLAYGKILLTEGEIVVTRFNTSGKLCALK